MKWIAALTALLLGLAACAGPTPLTPFNATHTPAAHLPNPASAYCEAQGYSLEIRTAADGSQSGVCVFADGSECDEWAYFRQTCGPRAATATTVAEVAEDGCLIYRNAELGYSFHYPATAQIVINDDPLGGLSIVGPVTNGEAWPQMSLSHPRDREDYRLPAGVDLTQWLTDHYLLGETSLPEMQIAGTTAAHFRHDRSPQSFAFDQYYFAHAGQLYLLILGHAGDKEDWEVYNHFLNNLRFDAPISN